MMMAPIPGGEGDGVGYRPMAEINVTPFVDVMLVLLVIFMVAAPLMMVAVPLDLPKTSAPQIAPKEESVVLSVGRDGDVFVLKEPIARESLVARLTQLHAERPDATIYVRGDKGVDYGQVMDVLGDVGRAGFAKISLVAEPASNPTPNGSR
jgi:biopolymer transport protein ExbD